MSQATSDGIQAAMMELTGKLLKIANLHADTLLKEQQTRYLPWQVWTAGAATGAALMGAAVGAGVALAHWH